MCTCFTHMFIRKKKISSWSVLVDVFNLKQNFRFIWNLVIFCDLWFRHRWKKQHEIKIHHQWSMFISFFSSSSSSLILILVFVNISIINIIITRRKLVNFRFDPCVFVCFQCIFLNFIIIVIENRSVCVCVVYRFWINIINFFLLIRFICFSSIWIRLCVCVCGYGSSYRRLNELKSINRLQDW